MKQRIRIIRKADIQKQYAHALSLELDYELATLFEAMQSRDAIQMEKSKKRLSEIQGELMKMRLYA